jgi:hypothetical protein
MLRTLNSPPPFDHQLITPSDAASSIYPSHETDPMMIHKISLALCMITALAVRVAAADVTNIPEIGAHQPILIVEKNVHPQNRMVVYTKIDADGYFQADPSSPDRPLLDFYWLMDGKTYKPVNPLIKSEIRKRLELQATPNGRATHFVININDLKEVNSDIKKPKVRVSIGGTADARNVDAEMNLGPSDNNVRIRVSSIYTEGRAFPPAVYSVTLKGEEITDGKLDGKIVTRKYEGKDKPN